MAGTGAYGIQVAETKAAEAEAAKFDAMLPKMQLAANNGAPADVLMKYIAANGMTLEEFNRHVAERDLQKTTRGGAFGGFIRQMAQGVLLGYGDEIASGITAAAKSTFGDQKFSDVYNQELESNRRADQAMETAHPAASTTARIGGALVPIIATAGSMAPAAPTSLLGATSRAVGAGAGYGAISGFGEGEGGFVPRLESAGQGALVGGVTAGLIPPALTGGRAVIRKIQQILGTANADDLAVQKVLLAMKRDNLTPEQAAAKYKDAISADPTKPVMFSDFGGENIRRLLDQSFLTPGQTAEKAAKALEERQTGMVARIQGDAAKFSQNMDTFGLRDSLMTTRSVAAAPLYERANAVPVKITPRVARFLDDPITQQAYEAGIKIQRLEAIAQGKPFLNRNGEQLIRNKPNFPMLTAVKEGLDDMLEKYRDPTSGVMRLDKHGIALKEFRDAYLDELDKMNPLYEEARAAWAGPSQAMDMIQFGKETLNRAPEVTAKMLGKASENDKVFFRIGLMRQIADQANKTADGANALNKFFNSRELRDRIRAGFGNDAEFAKFSKLMTIERMMFANAKKVLGNSATARRLAGISDTSQEGMNTVGKVLFGQWKDALRDLARTQVVRLGGMRPEVADKIGEILLTGTPKDVLAALKTLQAGPAKQAARSIPMTGGVVPALTGAAGQPTFQNTFGQPRQQSGAAQ